jgi:hypothetical protein
VSVVAVASTLRDNPATLRRTYDHLIENDDDRIRSVIDNLWRAEDSLTTHGTPTGTPATR